MSTATRRAIVALSRQVFEVYLLALAGLAGAQGLGASADTAAVEPVLPGWMRFVWFGGLLVGSVIVLVGIMAPPPHGQRIEGAGLLVLIGPALAYVVITCASGAWGQAVAVFGFAVALAVRAHDLRWEIKAVEAAMRVLGSHMDGES